MNENVTEGSSPLTKKERRELKKQQQSEFQRHAAKTQLIKRIALWSLAIAGLGGIIFGTIKFGGGSSSNSQTASLVDVISQSDWVKGNKDSKVILVEYSDFQCPACGYYYPLVKQLGEELGDKIVIAYRHFPLPQHQNGKAAAYAAEAAGKQGKFWDMHNMIFDNQSKWSEDKNGKDIFVGYAEALNLNLDQFKSDSESDIVKEKVDNDYQSGVRSKVDSTPTFFLNGKKIQNPQSYDEFKNIVNQVIAANS